MIFKNKKEKISKDWKLHDLWYRKRVMGNENLTQNEIVKALTSNSYLCAVKKKSLQPRVENATLQPAHIPLA